MVFRGARFGAELARWVTLALLWDGDNMDDVIEESGEITNDAGTFRALVLADPYNDANPREDYDHLGVMVADHSGYVLPQEDARTISGHYLLRDIEDHDFPIIARWLRVFHGATVVLPIFSAGGRDLRLSTGAPDDDATAGNYLGIIFDTPETREDLAPAVTVDEIVGWLRGEVAEYDTWANGEMTSWRVDRTDNGGDDETWDVVESCCGYYSAEEARREAMAQLPAIAAQALADHISALHSEALDENEIRDLAATEIGAP